MALLDYLLKYVRTGTAEGDRPFLGDTFVSPSQFDQLCAIEPGSMRLLVGNKGIGKSAVVEWIYKVASPRQLPCLLIRPDDIVTPAQPSAFDIGTLKAYYYDVILRTVASKIGSNLKGFLKGDAARLYNEAKQRGIAQGDIVQNALELVSAISMPVHKINGVQLAKDLAASNSAQALTNSISRQLLSSGSVFFLMIDDTDQLAAPDQTTHLNRIWGLILAMRRLAGECPAIRPIVSLRSSVWTRLTSESQGQRDQTDHMRGLVIPLLASDTLMQSIIRRRLERAAADASRVARGDPYSVFFEGENMTLPLSDEHRSWESFLTKSARERPRDAIQLIKNLIDAAMTGSHPKIGSADATKAMSVYSAERVDDVVNEFSVDCRTVREIVDSLADCEFESSFEAMRRHMRTVPSVASMQVRGKQMRPDHDEDAIALLELMHEAGVINPRIPDRAKERQFRHVNFHDDPNFVRMSNWNDMQGATWEIHPAFRTYLIGIRQSRVNRLLNPSSGGHKR